MPRERPASLKGRLLRAAAGWLVLALFTAGLFIHALLARFVTAQFDARLEAVALSLMASAAFDEEGLLRLERALADPAFDRVRSGWYWQIADETGVLLASRSLWDDELTETDRGPGGEPLHRLQRRFTAPGSAESLVLTVAGPRAEIEAALADVRRPLILALSVLGLGLLAAIGLQVRWGLQPLARLQRDLRAVREGRSERLAEPGVAEIQPLVAELNALLAHNRAVVERARTHVGNLAHALKTPLAVLATAAHRPAADPELAPAVQRLQRLIEHQLKRARAAAAPDQLGLRAPLRPVVDELARLMARVHAGKGLKWSLDVPERLAFAGDRRDLEELLGNLMDNAGKWAETTVWVAAHPVSERWLEIEVRDDGPGLPEAERERVCQRGVRLDESTPGDGLGLAIVADLADLYGGELMLETATPHGLRAALRLPAVPA